MALIITQIRESIGVRNRERVNPGTAGAFNWPVSIFSRIFLTVDVFYLQFRYKFYL